MQAAVINVAFGTVLVFLFGTVAWVRRPDDRAWCWFAGWLSVLGSFVAQLAGLHAAGMGKITLAAIEVDLIAVAGIFWVLSAAIPVRGRRFGIALGFVLAIPTVLCLTLATTNVQSRWLLLAVVAARQGLLTAMSAKMHRFRPNFGLFLMVVCPTDAVLMFYCILHGQAWLVIPAMLTEVYLIAGIDVWNKDIGQTIGMRVSSVGLLICASVFPLAEIAHRIWPQITTGSEMWNPPKSVVAVGMMLLVFEEEVRAARALARDYALIFDSNPNPLWIFDTESLRFRLANDAACKLHGYTQEEFLQLRLPDILHADARQEAMRESQRPSPTPNRASRHKRKDGSSFPMDITAHNVVFLGKPCRFVLGLDVTKRDNLERKLEYQLSHDALTGLPNRRAFEVQLVEAVAKTIKTGKKLAVLCLDIHRFKHLNEVYGLRIGDQCVRYVASTLSAQMRAMDFVARTGDDEFAVVLTGLRDLAAAEEFLVHLHECFKAPVAISEYDIQLSLSAGLAACPDDCADALALWHLAESALRRAQAKGSGQVVWLSPELRADAETRLEIAASMGKMMEEGQFRLVYQPLYGFDGTVRGLEALLRLDHPRYGAISPLTVIQTAEETGRIELLGQWVFDRACRQLRTWMDEGVHLVPMAINISPLQLMRKGFAERLADTLDRYAVNPQWIHLEITETAAMNNLKEVAGEMAILSALGCRFSIDDFGTGHSSLGRLHLLPISILKIDRSFIEQLCNPNGSGTPYSIVQAILSMAHAMELVVVAEGIETERQLNCLHHLGCDVLQGFLLSMPVPPEEIPALIAGPHPLLKDRTWTKPCALEPSSAHEDHLVTDGR
jgi:diguanylate cyclase (GGDEF)-like protein/PAS domain S-box-containing protein